MNTVPARNGRVPIPAPSASAANARNASAGTVILSVGDADLRAVARRVLEGAGYHVVVARHSGHALLACLTDARIDFLVTELHMADGSGRDLSERLRRHNPGLKSLYFSSDPAQAAHDVLVHPVTSDDLLVALRGIRVRTQN